jgi:3-hydroxyacyl-[acyl-carrier-protein] dehydratase
MSTERLQMKYSQLDRIVEIEPGKRLVAERTLRPDEEYLRDHFPKFPVMPGVMMLEALYQAAVWMVRTGEDFTSPLVLLKEAKSVKFGDFLAPGETLNITIEHVKDDGPLVVVKASAEKGGKTSVMARLVLEKCSTNLPAMLGTDCLLRQMARKKFEELFGPVDEIVNKTVA